MLVDADFDETTPYDVPKELKLFQDFSLRESGI
jgi:hypothetical protein